MYDITHIKNIYEKHIPKSINKLKEVTVMIALMNIKDSVHILFERRSGIVGKRRV